MPKPPRIFSFGFSNQPFPAVPHPPEATLRDASPCRRRSPSRRRFSSRSPAKRPTWATPSWVVGSVPEHLGLGGWGCLCQRYGGGFGALEKWGITEAWADQNEGGQLKKMICGFRLEFWTVCFGPPRLGSWEVKEGLQLETTADSFPLWKSPQVPIIPGKIQFKRLGETMAEGWRWATGSEGAIGDAFA